MHEWRGETTQDSLHRAHQEHVVNVLVGRETKRDERRIDDSVNGFIEMFEAHHDQSKRLELRGFLNDADNQYRIDGERPPIRGGQLKRVTPQSEHIERAAPTPRTNDCTSRR